MEQKPKLTVSGYRGIWGKDLNEQVAFEYALAFAKMTKRGGVKKVLVGRDTRKTGPQILGAVKSALEKEGLKMDYAGIIPTPSILLLVKKLSYDAGIIITASHNGKEYNGFKFIANDGLFIEQNEINELEEIREKLNKDENKYLKNVNLQNLELDNKNEEFRKIHIDEILKNINVNLIKSKKFKVALDPINSAGSIITQELLKELECTVYAINTEQDGEFAHEPEPLVKNLDQISKATIESNSDIGFAQDPDADRLVIVDEKGRILSEEYTLAFATLNVFSRKNEDADMAINMSTSRMCEDIANSHGKKMFRTKIGELNVVNKMIEINAKISGEGNGGVIYPKINKTRDSLVAIAFVLELLAKENKPVSSIVNNLPKYVMKKEKITFEKNIDSLNEKLRKEFSDANSINALDGIRFDWIDFSWIHIRPSNTEPKIWIISEAKNMSRIDNLFGRVKSIVLE